jgi:hypothetical protein
MSRRYISKARSNGSDTILSNLPISFDPTGFKKYFSPLALALEKRYVSHKDYGFIKIIDMNV